MEPTLLYGHPLGSSMGLVTALEWLGQPYRLCRVDMLGDMRAPSYARVNPRHETPVLITDAGRPLTETMAIAAYLEARDGGRRISFDPLSPEADRMHQLMAFVNTGFTAAFTPLWTRLEMEGGEPDYKAALRRLGEEQVRDRHDKLEAMVGTGSWLVSEQHSLADAVLVGVARWLEFHEVDTITRWPGLHALRTRIEADPAVQYAVAIENGETPPGNGACAGHVPLEELLSEFND